MSKLLGAFWSKNESTADRSLSDIKFDPKNILQSGIGGIAKGELFRQKDYTDSLLLEKIDWYVKKMGKWLQLHQTVKYMNAAKKLNVLDLSLPLLRVMEYIMKVMSEKINYVVERLTPNTPFLTIASPPEGMTRSSDMWALISSYGKIREYSEAFDILHKFDLFNRDQAAASPRADLDKTKYKELIKKLKELYNDVNGYNLGGQYYNLTNMETFDPIKENPLPGAKERIVNSYKHMLNPALYIGDEIPIGEESSHGNSSDDPEQDEWNKYFDSLFLKKEPCVSPAANWSDEQWCNAFEKMGKSSVSDDEKVSNENQDKEEWTEEQWDEVFSNLDKEEKPDWDNMSDEQWDRVFDQTSNEAMHIGFGLPGMSQKKPEVEIPDDFHERLTSPDFVAKVKEVENKFGDALSKFFKYVIVDFILLLDRSRNALPVQAWSLVGGISTFRKVTGYTTQRREALINAAMERVDAGKGSWFTEIIIAASELDRKGLRDLINMKTPKTESNKKIFEEAELDPTYAALLDLSAEDDKEKIDAVLKKYTEEENIRIAKIRENSRMEDDEKEKEINKMADNLKKDKKKRKFFQKFDMGITPKVYFQDSFTSVRSFGGNFLEWTNRKGPDYSKIMDMLGKIPIEKGFKFSTLRDKMESLMLKNLGIKKISGAYRMFNGFLGKIWFMLGPVISYAELLVDQSKGLLDKMNQGMQHYAAGYGDFMTIFYTFMNGYMIFFGELVIGYFMFAIKICYLLLRLAKWVIMQVIGKVIKI